MVSLVHGQNIALIGMAGCGKSTIGVLLAKALNLTFIDTDLMIQQKYGLLLWQLLEQEGIEAFIAKESEIIRGLTCSSTCIATGGSVVYSPEAMAHLKQLATIVFIHVSYPVIEKRLADIKSRGVVIEKGKTLKDLYSEREPLYNQYADLIIDGDEPGIEALVVLLIRQLKQAQH